MSNIIRFPNRSYPTTSQFYEGIEAARQTFNAAPLWRRLWAALRGRL